MALTRDMREVADGLEVTIRTSKTDKDSAGETIAIPRGSHPLTDPVTAWRDWLHVLDQAGHTTGRLLRRINRHGGVGPSLGAHAVNTIVRDLAVRAGVPYARTVTAHSLRAGGATVAYAAGVPVAVIAKHGRWAPASPVVLRYIRAVDRSGSSTGISWHFLLTCLAKQQVICSMGAVSEWHIALTCQWAG
ncbi:hypothetical protein ACIBQX_43820 [Nonomuraea sp. NPDC049714]|uniref:hypothetical protein n=1 Tax=Nonomuraea sp. NPDC049714 TaxID=3364357 RepID=UPI00379B42B8